MTNIDLERIKEKAIEEAVSGHYEAAIALNLQILTADPRDVDSLMQLAHAYWQSGHPTEAKKNYRRALELEPNNNLAKKRLALLNAVNHKTVMVTSRSRGQVKIVPLSDLIEEPGKTKIVKLSNIGKPEHLALLRIGEELFVKIRKRRLELRDLSHNFIGCLPDDISKRLIEFINHKGVYEAFVFSIDKNEVKVFLREIKKPTKYHHVSSFVSEDIVPEISDDEESVSETDPKELDLDTDKILLTPDEIVQDSEPEEAGKEETDDEEDEYHEYEE